MDSKIGKQITEIYLTSRPIILVLIFASLIVFVNSYPNVPEIADNTKDYRQIVMNKGNLNETAKDDLDIKPPSSPSLPNTITPIISPEKVDDIAHPKPKPTPANNTTGEIPDSDARRKEPSLGIKLLTGFLNVAPLILIAALGGFGIYLLFKYKKHFTLRSMFSTAIALVAICALVFFGVISFNFIEFLYNIDIDTNLMIIILLPPALVAGMWISYSIISKRTTIFRRNMGLAISGGLMGSFLAAFLPFWIIFILLIAIALFDIYSVKYGPIKKILDLEEQNSKKKAEKMAEKKVEKLIVYRKLNSTPNSNSKSIPNSIPGSSSAVDVISNNSDGPKDTVAGLDNSAPLSTTTTKNTEHQQTNNGSNTDNKSNPKANTNTTLVKQEQKNSKSSINVSRKKPDDEFDLMLMYDNPNWSLGLGDFVIYSMFTSAVLTYCLLYLPYYIFYSPSLGLILPWLIFFISMLGLLLGFFLTLRLLKKRDYLPGLPITIGCGFLVFVTCIIILQVVNYVMFNEFVIII